MQHQPEGDPEKRPGAEPVQENQRHAQHSNHQENVAAVNDPVPVAEQGQHPETPQEATPEIDPVRRPPVQDQKETEAEHQRKDRVRLASEKKESDVVRVPVEVSNQSGALTG